MGWIVCILTVCVCVFVCAVSFVEGALYCCRCQRASSMENSEMEWDERKKIKAHLYFKKRGSMTQSLDKWSSDPLSHVFLCLSPNFRTFFLFLFGPLSLSLYLSHTYTNTYTSLALSSGCCFFFNFSTFCVFVFPIFMLPVVVVVVIISIFLFFQM